MIQTMSRRHNKIYKNNPHKMLVDNFKTLLAEKLQKLLIIRKVSNLSMDTKANTEAFVH